MKLILLITIAAFAPTSFAQPPKLLKLIGTGNGISFYDPASKGVKGSSETARTNAEKNLKLKFENFCTKNYKGTVSNIEVTEITESKKTSSGIEGSIISYSATVTGTARCNY